MELTDSAVSKFQSGRTFKDYKGHINSLSFHRSEDLLVTACDDDSVHVYNVHAGSQHKLLYSRKYGVSHVCFTHSPDAILHCSTKVPSPTENTIRYLSMHDNKYMRYFRGHTEEVTSLDISPNSDAFLSAAKDCDVRLWDLRTADCQGLLTCPGTPTAAYDPQGLVFCVATVAGILKLYDARNYTQGPFEAFLIPEEANSAAPLTGVSFSVAGQHLCAMAGPTLYVLDAFEGQVLHRFNTGCPEGAAPFQPSFTPTSTHISCGCEDGNIRTWSLATGAEVACWKGHAGRPAALQWAPRKALVASACSALVLWLPVPGSLQPPAG